MHEATGKQTLKSKHKFIIFVGRTAVKYASHCNVIVFRLVLLQKTIEQFVDKVNGRTVSQLSLHEKAQLAQCPAQ